MAQFSAGQLAQFSPGFYTYYLWGQVNYNSEGDCKSPTDRQWTWLELENRETRERIEISGEAKQWEVTGADPHAARTAFFLVHRCVAVPTGPNPEEYLGAGWDHLRASARAERVRETFECPELKPFDNGHLFWGSWKWIGWFATEFTWVGRWIMHSVLTNESRAVELCASWLREGTVAEGQSTALRYALARLTGRSFATDEEWVQWYYGGEGQRLYPEPDFDAWYEELKPAEEER